MLRCKKRGAKRLKSLYSAPYTHHSPMEPQNATAIVNGDNCEIWAPSQAPDISQAVAAHYTGITRSNIVVHALTLGGAFGRRGYVDFIGEVVAIAQQIPGTAVKLVWSREDDMQHDFYRPATMHEMSGTLAENGKIDSWQHRLVSPSIVKGLGVSLASTILPEWVPTKMARAIGRKSGELFAGADPTTAEGAKVAYDIPNFAVEQILQDSGVPIGFWRSVGFSHNCFVAESFVDELAHAADQDPVKFRLAHLRKCSTLSSCFETSRRKIRLGQSTQRSFSGNCGGRTV